MASLPHYTNSKASVNKWEFVAGNLFEVTILPPPGVAGGEILLEHVRSVGGITTDLGQEAVEQEFKTAKRSHLSTVPTNTIVDLAINFSMNLNDDNQNYVYNTLKAWKNLGYNALTGKMGLKKDYADAKVIVTMYNRPGDIHWQRTFHDCFINGDIPEIALDYTNGEPTELEITIRSDYWTENQA